MGLKQVVQTLGFDKFQPEIQTLAKNWRFSCHRSSVFNINEDKSKTCSSWKPFKAPPVGIGLDEASGCRPEAVARNVDPQGLSALFSLKQQNNLVLKIFVYLRKKNICCLSCLNCFYSFVFLLLDWAENRVGAWSMVKISRFQCSNVSMVVSCSLQDSRVQEFRTIFLWASNDFQRRIPASLIIFLLKAMSFLLNTWLFRQKAALSYQKPWCS